MRNERRLQEMASAQDKTKAIREAQCDYLDQVTDSTGWSLTALAEQAGVRSSTLTRFRNNPDHKTLLSATTLAKIETLTGYRAPVPTSAIQTRAPVRTLMVRGIASAGVWREVGLVDAEPTEAISVGPDPRYEGKTQYALKIDGDSVNKKIQDGGYAICVKWDEIGATWPQDGQLVHVTRQHGGLIEVTIKQFRIVAGEPQLWSCSTDPKYQGPIHLANSDEDTEITFAGLVIGFYLHA